MDSRTRRIACSLAALLALIALAGCDRAPSTSRAAEKPASPASDPLPPPIKPPTDGTEAAEPPSYEVAIATAAAERNRAKKKCAELPETERLTCEKNADAAFDSASTDLEDLRGNQE